MKTIKNETRRQAGHHHAVTALSTIAGAVALLGASSGSAFAANECGAATDQIFCTANAYTGGISYIVPTTSGATLTLDNPAMVVTGSNVQLTQNASTVTADTLLHVKNVSSITAANQTVYAVGLRAGTTIGVTVDSGTITSTASTSTTVRSLGSQGASALVTLNGGTIVNAGAANGSAVNAINSGVNSTGNATVVINGGIVDNRATGSSIAVLAQINSVNGTGTATAVVNGGTITSAGISGVAAMTTGRGRTIAQVTGGTISALGTNADGLLVSHSNVANTAAFQVDVTGGTITGGDGFGAGIHTGSRGGGVLNVGTGAIVNGGASGVAIRNGDLNKDGIDEIAGNVRMTLGGTINGAVLMGAGTDTLTITGGSIAGNIVADANDALTFDTGANRFVYGSPYAITDFGSITMSSGDVRVDGLLTGGTLTVNGGSLELTNTANAYTGGTFLNGGVLSISSDANLGPAGTTLAFNGGTLRGTSAFTTGRTMTLGVNGGTLQADAPMLVTSAISGTGNLTKTGTSTLTLSAAQAYTGTTTISAGTLALTGNGSLASSSRVIADGLFDISGVSGVGTDIQSLGGNGGVFLGDRTLTLDAASGSFDGTISGTGGLTIGAGAQTLGGVNTYSGDTTIASGATLALSGNGSIANSARVVANGAFDLSAAGNGGAAIRSLAGNGLVNLGANTLTLSNANDSFGGAIIGSGGLTVAGGAQTLTGVNTYTGDTTIGFGGTLALSGNGSIASSRVVANGTLDISAAGNGGTGVRSLSGFGTVALGANTLTLSAAGDTFGGNIVGTGGLTVAGGTQTLSGVQFFTGETTIANGATLAMTGGSSLAASRRVVADGRFDISGVSAPGASIRSLAGAGTVDLGAKTLTLSAAADTFGGSISGSGGITVAGGTQTLTGLNSYGGATTIASGATLALSGDGTIQTSAKVVADGGFDISGVNAGNTRIRSLSGAGNVNLGASTLVLSNAADSFGGTISGTGSLSAAGGTQTLTGTNTYTGDTLIGSTGTLALSGNGSIANSRRVLVNGRFDIGGTTGGASIRSLASIGTGTGTVNLADKTLTLTAAGDTFGGTIVGTGGLTAAGGAQTLSGVNPYTGITRIANGATLALSGNGSVAASARVTDDGLFDLSAITPANASIRSLAGAGTVNLGGKTLTLTNAADTFSGAINGTGGLSLASGTQTLSGVNGYTGDTAIASGATLALSGNGSIAGSNRVVADGGFDVSGASAGASIRSLSGAGTVTLGGQTLTLSAAGDTFGGTIAGTGGLSVTGGTEVLTGANTYTGGTTLQGGTLQLGSGGTSGAIVGPVVNHGTLIFNRSDAVVFGNAVSGDGLIRQIGSGLTRITADNSGFTGTTRVEAGTLAVDGALGGTTQVLAGARLQGNGTVGALNVAGTVAPGNSIGTLHVAGDFAQTSGSVYQVEVDANSTASDQLLISGKATLANGSQLDIVRTDPSATYRLNTRYTVLTANGGLTGTYLLTGDTRSAFIKLVDQYDANHVYLVATQVREFSDVAQTPNQIAVGGALDQSTASNDLLTAIGWLPDEQSAREAFDQLSGEIHATLKTALIEDTRFVRDTALARLRVDACGTSLSRVSRVADGGCLDASGSFQDWAQVYGATGSIDADGNAHRMKRHLSGFMLGADRALAQGWRVGGLAGYNRSTVAVRADDAKVDQFHLGVYAGWQSGANALRFGASHTWASADVQRQVRFQGFADALASRQDSRLLQVFGEAARRVDMRGVALEPFVDLAYVMLHSDALAERGGLAALRAGSGNDQTGFATAGLRVSREVNEQTKLQAQFGWRRAFGDTTPNRAMSFADDTSFQLRGLPIARNAATVELGAETQWRPGATLSLVYSGQYSGSMEDHGFRLRASWVF